MNRRYQDEEADRATERAIRATEIVRILSSLSSELVAMASSEPIPEAGRLAQDSSVAVAEAARATAHLADRYVVRAVDLYDGGGSLGARAAAGCRRAVRAELQGLPTTETFRPHATGEAV